MIGAEDRRVPGVDGEDVVDRVRAEVGLRLGLDRRVGVAAVGERPRDGVLRLLVRVLVEARARGAAPRRPPLATAATSSAGRPSMPSSVTLRSSVGRPLVDDDLDAHVVGRHVDDARRARVRVEEPAPAVVALDPGEVALQHRLVVDRVVVDDAAEEAEELGARGRGELDR